MLVSDKGMDLKTKWFICNSTHVVDLAFHLGGQPISLNCSSSGADELPWHPANCRFSGYGETKNGAMLSYFSDWNSAGRWKVELLSRNLKIILLNYLIKANLFLRTLLKGA